MSHKRRSVPLRIAVGDPEDVARFWAKVQRGGPDECWLWTASTSGSPRHRYGQFTLNWNGAQRHIGAHVFSYILVHGEFEDGGKVCHRCDNPPCCNPAHLFLGDHAANMQDAAAKGKFSFPRTHFHKLSPAEIELIRAEVATGPRGTAARLAREKGVTEAHISQLVHGQARRHDAPLAPRLVRRAS